MIVLLIMLAPITGYVMLTRKDSGGITNCNETRVDMCVNLTGLEKAKCCSDKASCYFRVVKASNNTGHIREMCDHMDGNMGARAKCHEILQRLCVT